MDYPLLGIMIEVVDHPPLIKIMFTSEEKMVASIEEIFVTLKHMQQKIQSFCESITYL
jgi:hypothetical protein